MVYVEIPQRGGREGGLECVLLNYQFPSRFVPPVNPLIHRALGVGCTGIQQYSSQSSCSPPPYQTLSVKGLLKAPKPLVNLFRKNAFLRAEYAKAGKEYGQDLPLHDDDDDEEDTAPVPMPTPDEKSETAGGGGEEEEEGRPEGARGKPAAVEPESKRGDRRREGGSVAPGAAREAAKGEGDEDNVKPAAEPEPSSEADDTEEDAYSSEEESDSGGGNDEAEGNEAGEEQSNEEEELSEESDELEDFEGEAESMLGESEDDLDVEELTDSFEESEEDEESASSSDF